MHSALDGAGITVVYGQLYVICYCLWWFKCCIHRITKLLSVCYTVWSREELIKAFMPIWQKIYFQEPEGILFRLPVDPVALGVPVSDCIARVNVCICCFQKFRNFAAPFSKV